MRVDDAHVCAVLRAVAVDESWLVAAHCDGVPQARSSERRNIPTAATSCPVSILLAAQWTNVDEKSESGQSLWL
jgi:hypothetical protein